jgi:RsiW-degrading membrane proteinase PrsW (M82 family)
LLLKHRNPWRASLLAVAALALFVALVIGIDQGFHFQFSGTGLLLAGGVMALVPALTWLAIFYWQDRLQPEPLAEVARTFVIGLALAGALSLPLVERGFDLRQWLYRDNLGMWFGAVCLLGGVQAFTVYAAVRYFVFASPAFDERVDGVVYGTAAALGMATAWNLDFILSSGGAALGASMVYISETALAQAALGGLLGYFLGRAKMERDPVGWLPLGVALTALLNGAFFLLSHQVAAGQASLDAGAAAGLPDLAGLLLAGLLALALTALVFGLVQRDIRRAQAGQTRPPDPDRQVGDRRSNFWVLGLLGALLLAGAGARAFVVDRQMVFTANGLRLAYPANLRVLPAPGCLLHLADPAYGTVEFSLCLTELQPGETLDAAAARLEAASAAGVELYSTLGQGPARLAGQPALRSSFAWVQPGLPGLPPRLRMGEQVLALYRGQVLSLRMLSSEADLPAARLEFEQLLVNLTGLQP